MCSQWWCVLFCALLLREFDSARGRHWQRHESEQEGPSSPDLQKFSSTPPSPSSSHSAQMTAVNIAPVFMRLLLRRAESGRLQLTEDTGDGFRALVRSVPPTAVSIDPDGDVHIRFSAAPDPPLDSDPDSSVCAVVLAFRDRPPELEGVDLSVELRDATGALSQAAVPPGKAFVSFAVDCRGPEPLQLTASVLGARTPLDGAALLELGGAQLEPLLIRYRSHILTGGPNRVWPLAAEDVDVSGAGVTNEMESHRKHRRRRRRRQGSDGPDPEDDHCHLQEWVVSTEEMGWNFIVYPTSISVNLCVGECSSPLLIRKHYNATTHAIARDVYRMNSNNPDANQVPSAKCVPIQYRKLALLIERSPGSYSLEYNSDLSASRCGCR